MNDVSPSAIDAVYVATYDAMRYYARTHLPPDAVDDAIQDAWTYVLLRGPENIINLGAYAYLKLVSVVADFYRQRRHRVLVDIDTAGVSCNPWSAVDARIDAEAELAAVLAALRLLTAKQQAIIEVVIVTDGQEAIGRGANKTALYRARCNLRELTRYKRDRSEG